MGNREIEIYLCRHGETEWTVSGQHTGETDIALTVTGRRQALELGKKLARLNLGRVLSSPLKRAVETCKLAAGDSFLLEPNAVEWRYGKYEGKKHEDLPADWDLFRDGAPGGESVEAVGRRADLVLERLKEGGTLFSHGHFLRVLAARWLGLDPAMGRCFYLSVASLSVLGFEHGKPVVKQWNLCGVTIQDGKTESK